MHARLSRFVVQPGKLDQAARIMRNSVLMNAQQQRGFKGALMLTDPASNRGATITLWQTEADMKAGEVGTYYQDQVRKAAEVFAEFPIVEHYQVRFQV